MRSTSPGSFHLSFLLPKGVFAVGGDVATAGCKVRVSPPLVKISGPSRERVFEVATAFLRHVCRNHAPLSITAMLVSPPPVSGSDGWSIAVGAEVAFAPTSLGHWLPQPLGDSRVAKMRPMA